MIRLVNQSGSSSENVSIGDNVTILHTVVKNSPFLVLIEFDSILENKQIGIDCSLFYETEPRKPVDFLLAKPIDFKVIPTQTRNHISLEMRVKVLTSQREDIFFNVLIQLMDPETNTPILGLNCFTQPIRVVSKTEQIKKAKQDSKKIIKIKPISSHRVQLPFLSISPQHLNAHTSSIGVALKLNEIENESNDAHMFELTQNSMRVDDITQRQSANNLNYSLQRSQLTFEGTIERLKGIEEELLSLNRMIAPNSIDYYTNTPQQISSSSAPPTSFALNTQNFGDSSPFITTPDLLRSPIAPDDSQTISVNESKRFRESSDGVFSHNLFSRSLSSVCAIFKSMDLSHRDNAVMSLIDTLTLHDADMLDDLLGVFERTGFRTSITTEELENDPFSLHL